MIQVSDWQDRPTTTTIVGGVGRDHRLGGAIFSALHPPLKQHCIPAVHCGGGREAERQRREGREGRGTIPPDSIVGCRPGGGGEVQRWEAHCANTPLNALQQGSLSKIHSV